MSAHAMSAAFEWVISFARRRVHARAETQGS